MSPTDEKAAPERYDPKAAEQKWQAFWQEQNLYAFDATSNKPIFSVDTPPPTVSGVMHLGHAFSYAQQDYVARFQRMRGKNVFYPFGTDDNGLPTEKLVEKTNKVRAKDMSREEFRKLCLEFVNEHKPAFMADWITLGMSCDFKKSYSTIDPLSQKIGQQSFLTLYNQGHVYRSDQPVSWCPSCRTAIAQADFESVDMKSHFNDIIFMCGAQELVIGTTRPELIPACVCLAHHPSDTRYTALKGKFAKLPLFDREVPIITDESVDPEKGSGLMMVCTFGDKEDIEKWHKHDLELRIVVGDDGRLTAAAGAYEGLTLREARKKILIDLKESGDLVLQKNIVHAVNVHERCGTEVEFLKKAQWMIRALDQKQELIDAGNKINWYPKHMKARYDHWVENLNWDWCISRQRFYGVPFPVWYDAKGEIVLPSEDQLPVDPLVDSPNGYDVSKGALTPETDVYDTWMVSSVSPQLATQHEGAEQLTHPMSFRPQGHDIIRTWAFYTITKSLLERKDIPWADLMITGHVLDPKGNKMSKSKGNVVAPQGVIDTYCADALRYWAAGVKLGDDLPYMEKDIKTGQKTVNKLFNAAKFTLSHLEDFSGYTGELEVLDAWLLSKLQRIIKEATDAFEVYEYSKTRFLVDQFFWQQFCDQYLEITKGRLYNVEDFPEARASAQFTLYESLLAMLKMFAPIMPHITEEIYQKYFAQKEQQVSIHTSAWPAYNAEFINEDAEKIGDVMMEVIDAVRKTKSAAQVSLRAPVKNLIVTCPVDLSGVEADLINVTGAKHFEHKQGEFNVVCEL